MFAYDDSLDVFGVHGVGSMTGMLMLGFLASAEVNPAIATTFKANGVAVSLAGGSAAIFQPAIGVMFTAIFARRRHVHSSSSWWTQLIGLRVESGGRKTPAWTCRNTASALIQ